MSVERIFCLLLGLVFTCLTSWAQDLIYCVDDDDYTSEFWSLDVDNCNRTGIGWAYQSRVFTDIGMSPHDSLIYGIAEDVEFWKFNPNTGKSTFIGHTNPFINSIVFSSEGICYAVSGNDLHTINISTGKVTTIGEIRDNSMPDGGIIISAGDMAFYQGNLYLSAYINGQLSFDYLVQVNISDPSQSKVIGEIDLPGNVMAMATLWNEDNCSEELYIFSDIDVYKVEGDSLSKFTLTCDNWTPITFGAASLPIQPTINVDYKLTYQSNCDRFGASIADVEIIVPGDNQEYQPTCQ